MTRIVCQSLALLVGFILPLSAFAQQITLVDQQISHTQATGAFIDLSLPGGFPTDLVSPDDYSAGTLHHRVQVSAIPGSKIASYEICLVQGGNSACSDYSALQFDAAGTFTATQAVSTFNRFGAVTFAAGLTGLQVVARDANGYAIDATDNMWDGSPDFTLYYPLNLTYQAVLVAQGGVFAGFPGAVTKVANPTFGPAPGAYPNSVNVTLSSATADAEIHFTTDGSDPDMTSTLYASAIQLTANTTIKAIGLKGGLTASDIVSGAYTITQPTSGLTGRYYNGVDFADLAHTRVDPTINLNITSGENPAPNTNSTCSIIWTGTVTPIYSEQYTFTTVNDDGVRVWINDQLIIDDANYHGPETHTGNITLQAGQAYPVWIEYFNGGGDGEISFSWVSATQPEEIIPDAAYGPTAPAGGTTVSLLMNEDYATWAETATDPIIMEVRRRGNLDAALRVELEYSGAAVNGTDYEQLPAYVDIPAGSLSAQISIQPIIDGEVEGEEDLIVTIKDGAYTLNPPSTQTVTLLDFDENTYTLAGEVIYTGTTSGKIYVQAFTAEDQEFQKRSVILTDPGAFAIADISEGVYNVIAFIDTNDNERLDTGEVWTQYGGAEETKVTIPPTAIDITLTLSDSIVKAEDTGGSGDDEGCNTVGGQQGWLALGLIGLVGLIRRRRR